MKKIFLSIAGAMIFSYSATAQQYILVNDDELPVLADNVEKITYEEDSLFEDTLLTGRLAADPRTHIFSQALELTGLADTLRRNYGYIFNDGIQMKYRYRAYTRSEVAWRNTHRYKMYTVFAETDEVFAAQGINTIGDLKAYAKSVYDDAFPEDAGISDPTNRKNSLNRFVAYHIMNYYLSYWYLTFYDGKKTDKFVDPKLTDISTWYATLMPEASLKFSYPLIGDDSGIYLNRRGLKDGPDKYGKQIRGAKILADGDDKFEHECFNGYYYHIDQVLAYDQTTRNDVLGSELWRVDFKTLSPDIMNNAVDLRGNYMVDDNQNIPDDSPTPQNGKNFFYMWDRLENIKSNIPTPMHKDEYGDDVYDSHFVARRAHAYFWCWQGDEINIFGKFDFTIKLPPLPEGEWEIRMGHCDIPSRPSMRVYINEEVTIDSIDLRKTYAVMPFEEQGDLRTPIADYIVKNYLMMEKQDAGWLVTDMKTGETMIYTSNNGMSYIISYQRKFVGVDPNTGEPVDWTERLNTYREQATTEYLNTLPKSQIVMKSPRECCLINGESFSIDSGSGLVRIPLGRVKSDGRSNIYLRFQSLTEPLTEGDSQAMFDYFEFCPKAIYDNPNIPEE